MHYRRPRYWPVWLACGLVLALAVWVRPRRIETLATLDGKHRWLVENDAPARQFAWQPGEELSGLLPPHDPPDDISHPCVADGGRTLFITVRRGGGDADIYRSARSGGRWQPAEPVTELNTPWDEVGAAVSSDGHELYLASNRHGGRGGFDLYMAPQRSDRWGVPKNLNAVNSSADDFDPAVSPDSLRLCFASNRGDAETSDLYSADRAATDGPWAAAEPLRRANSIASERSPSFAEEGAVLYFAREHAERGRPPDYNLFRLRLSDLAATVESLGAGINSPANESDPAPSPDGFSIRFTCRLGDEPGTLYESRLAEVERVEVWDNRRWLAVRAVWWKTLLASLACVAMLTALYYGGGWMTRQASAARFIAASVLVHLAMLWLLLLVPLSQQIIRRFEEVQVSGDAAELFDDNLAESQAVGEPAYEKVADLKSVEEVETPPALRQAIDPAESALQADEGFRPALPLDATHRLPADRVLFLPPQRNMAAETPGIERRRATGVHVAATEPLAAAPPTKIARPDEERLQETVELPRAAAAISPPPLSSTPEQPPPEMTLARPVLEPVAPQMRGAHEKEGPPRQLVYQSAPPAMIDSDAQIITAVERADEKAVLAAAPPQLKIDSQQITVAPALSDELATPRTMPATVAPLPLRPEASEPRALSPVITIERKMHGPAVVAGAAEEAAAIAKVDALAEQAIPAAKVDLPVVTPAVPRLPANLSEGGQPPPAAKRDPISGTLAKQPAAILPAANLRETSLDRPAIQATPLALAEDNLGMQAMFALRQGDTRREFIELVGGNDETEEAVGRGLKWLSDHQYGDGHWSLHQIDPPEKKLPATSGAGGIASDTAATGLALLCFLGSGETQLAGDHRAVVAGGVDWLLANQKADGNLFTGSASNAFMYSHGIASIALCEAYGLSQDERLREPAERALKFIMAAQHRESGGWRYSPGEPGDTSVVGWQVMALKSGEMARLEVPPAVLDLANKWLTHAAGSGGSFGQFGYQGPGGSPAMTAEGLLCRQFLGSPRNDPALLAGATYLRARLPKAGEESSYYWYYATQVMYHMQGDYWTEWNERLRPLLLSSQTKDGHQAGTWDPSDGWERQGGRLYATALRVLMLEVYYRHLPLYQQWQ